MSTILKSLKKLEKQKETSHYAGSSAAYHGPGSLDPRGSSGKRSKTAWIRWSLVGLVIIGLGSSSLYFYNQSRKSNNNQVALNAASSNRTQAKVQKAPQAPKPKKTAPAVNRKTTAVPALPGPSPARQTSREGAQPSGTVAKKTVHRKNVQAIPLPGSPEDESGSVVNAPPNTAEAGNPKMPGQTKPFQQPQVAAGPKTISPRKPAPKAFKSTATSRKTEAEKPNPAVEAPEDEGSDQYYENLAVLKGDRLEVQAIVWSTVSDDRMAVINSKVVYEGDVVDGFNIVAIRPDDVVVKEGSQQYLAPFGR